MNFPNKKILRNIIPSEKKYRQRDTFLLIMKSFKKPYFVHISIEKVVHFDFAIIRLPQHQSNGLFCSWVFRFL